MTDEPPRKVGEPTWYECKWCDHRQVCHHNAPVEKNCRTCLFGEIHPNAEWHCGSQKGKNLSVDEQRAGCVLWEKLPTL